MLWFQKSRTENVEVVATMATLKQDRLTVVETLYRQAEDKFQEAILRFVRHRNDHRERSMFALGGKLFVRVNPTPDPELDLLAHERCQAESLRNELLAERWELRKSLGLSR